VYVKHIVGHSEYDKLRKRYERRPTDEFLKWLSQVLDVNYLVRPVTLIVAEQTWDDLGEVYKDED
jgi:hypothetical protein